MRPLQAFYRFDWVLFIAVLPLLLFGLITMKSIGTDGVPDYFFTRQLIWIGVGLIAFFVFTFIDWRVYETSSALLLGLYGTGVALLFILFAGSIIRGVQSWIQLPFFSIAPAEFMKLILILVLAKYFARRHVEIALSKHLVISALYAGIPFALIALQPDIGTALVIGLIWAGLILFSGINIKQLSILAAIAIIGSVFMWGFVLGDYQKNRIISFLAPASDPQGAGYHSIQATIAVGSGELFGKGVGYGTQSRLRFLPESQNDFIFAAFVEEWGVLGALVVFTLFGVIFWRLFRIAFQAEGNFPQLVVLGIILLLFGHIVIHIGMNTGLLPVTGISMPFMSYGGSLMVTLLASLGIAESVAIHSSFLGRRQIAESSLPEFD